MRLKILAYSDTAPLLPALESLFTQSPALQCEAYCLCKDNEALATAALCSELINSKKVIAARIFTYSEFSSFKSLANKLFRSPEACKDLFFFSSSDVILHSGSLNLLVEYFIKNPSLAGVNPLLEAGWDSSVRGTTAFAGIVGDCQKQLHYIYEGVPTTDPLLDRTRIFQLAHHGALLISAEDFNRAGGFQENLEPLDFISLCLNIRNLKRTGFACLHDARGILLNQFDSWDFCGTWNSILQRGRLDDEIISADYPQFCIEDQLDYSCDEWLCEGPQNLHCMECQNSRLNWIYHPNPLTLLKYLASLSGTEQRIGVELARNRPSSLPRSLRYYQVQAEKIAAYSNNLPALGESVANWHKRIRQFHYRSLKSGIKQLTNAGIYNCSLDSCPAIFDAWIETVERPAKLETGSTWPKIAVAMPVWNPEPDFLIQAIHSVQEQTYSNWQLCIADDASSDPRIRTILEEFQAQDPRIRITFREQNGHICHATNSALELVDAPFTGFLDHDDLLAQNALGEVAALTAHNPDIGFIYTDDDRIDRNNIRRNPVFKPDFDRDLFATGHFSVYATKLIRKVGGLRPGREGSQDLDLRLRVTELLPEADIAHIPHILYHWRVHENSTAGTLHAKPYVIENTKKVLEEAAIRRGFVPSGVKEEKYKFYQLLFTPPANLSVSVVLLTDGAIPSPGLLACLDELAAYCQIEILVQPLLANINCNSLPDNYKFLTFSSSNIAAACNSAAAKAEGEIILFLSTKLRPWGECRLEQLLVFAMRDDIALAGATLWDGDQLLNGGWYPDVTGNVFPLLRGMKRVQTENYAWGHFSLPRHTLGVPWECMAMRRNNTPVFLNEAYGQFATVDFTLRAMERNKFTLVTPLVNFQSDGLDLNADAANRLHADWGRKIAQNGLRNPNLRATIDNDWTLIL